TALFPFLVLLLRSPSLSTFFPYTTLFRSTGTLLPGAGGRRLASRRDWDCGHARGRALPSPSIGDCTRWRDWRSPWFGPLDSRVRSEEHTSELQSRGHLVCRLLLEKKKT